MLHEGNTECGSALHIGTAQRLHPGIAYTSVSCWPLAFPTVGLLTSVGITTHTHRSQVALRRTFTRSTFGLAQLVPVVNYLGTYSLSDAGRPCMRCNL